MRCLLLVLCVLALYGSAALPAAAQPVRFDVVVYGGTSGGVIAAYTARQYGHSVLLVEPGRHLGGMSSGGLGQTDIGNKYAVTGLARDFYRRVGRVYGELESWTFEPHVAEDVFEWYVDEAGVEVWFSRRLRSVAKQGAALQSITLEPSNGSGASPITVGAGLFIDASYEGDLMARAGVSYTVGREPNSRYGETLNGVQHFGLHQFPPGIDPYVVPGDPASGLLPEISGVGLEPRGSGDRKVQAYNFRTSLCQGDLSLGLPEPQHYDPDRYELLARLMEAQPPRSLNADLVHIQPMPGGKTDWNNRGGFSTDYIGKNWDYPEADYDRRAQIWQDHVDYQQGLLHFLAHDARVPAHIREEMQTWGVCRDEFLDTGGWPHQLYVREARRMIGELVMTEHHAVGREVAAIPVGMAAYTMDSHNTQRVVLDGPEGPHVQNEGDVQVGGWPGDNLDGAVEVYPYPIGYRAITPRREEATNLLVPVALSASHIAYGSIRMEPVFMVLGQAAGVAAALALASGLPVQAIDTDQLLAELRQNPLADGSTPEILIDDDDPRVTTTAYWTRRPSKGMAGAYGRTVTHDGGTAADGTIRFAAEIERAGDYAVYVYWPRHAEAATNVAVTVQHAGGRQTQTVDQRASWGDWHALGTFRFAPGADAYVELHNLHDQPADGIVLADAVLFLPHFD